MSCNSRPWVTRLGFINQNMRQPTINYSVLFIVVAREILSLFQLYFPNSGNESHTFPLKVWSLHCGGWSQKRQKHSFQGAYSLLENTVKDLAIVDIFPLCLSRIVTFPSSLLVMVCILSSSL